MSYPLTKQELLKQIALETARISYPGGMSRGAKQVVKAHTKEKIERYFVTKFPMCALRDNASGIASAYDSWHEQQAAAIGIFLEQQSCLGNPDNNKFVVGAKFLNTFMHQLMKYEWARPLWQQLHLPLDARVFYAFAHIESPSIEKINSRIGMKTAYSISRKDYQFIQATLREFVDELNKRPEVEFQVQSRIELNYLWLDETP
jgi:hypothetical protein